jgi:hypothetical protein
MRYYSAPQMADRTIPERELRNNVSAAEVGETFTDPAGEGGQPRTDVDCATLRRILAQPLDDELPEELDAAEGPVDDT